MPLHILYIHLGRTHYQCLTQSRYSLMAVNNVHTSLRFMSSCKAIRSKADRPLKYLQKAGQASATRSSRSAVLSRYLGVILEEAWFEAVALLLGCSIRLVVVAVVVVVASLTLEDWWPW